MNVAMKVTTTLTLEKEELRIIGLALLKNAMKGADRDAALALNVKLQGLLTQAFDERARQLHEQHELALGAAKVDKEE